ncbi:MAG: helix-turn-helix transcriptional regulator [Lachnospiraceae bacterium]|nr:helix-turn-helix transcriptional regulator [Lachnospiraceae bacterium]
MDQVKIGKFIAERRKEKEYTQKQLAEQLEISDRTVSKWERGNGMPEVSLMLPLCEALGISVNELLSGERLTSESYSEKAEENMMNLMKEKGQKDTVSIVLAWIGILAVAVVVYLMGAMLRAEVQYYFDIVNILFMLGITVVMLLVTRTGGDFLSAFSYVFGKADHLTGQELKRAEQAVRFVEKVQIRSAFLIGSFSLLNVLYNIADLKSTGPNLAVITLSFFYAAVVLLLLLPIRVRLRKMQEMA